MPHLPGTLGPPPKSWGGGGPALVLGRTHPVRGTCDQRTEAPFWGCRWCSLSPAAPPPHSKAHAQNGTLGISGLRRSQRKRIVLKLYFRYLLSRGKNGLFSSLE